MAVDWETQGALEGLEGEEQRQARVELLEELHRDGFSLDELREAHEQGRLPLLPAERALQGDGDRYTLAEVAERSGLDQDFLEATWRALGVARPDPDSPSLTEAELENACTLKRFLDVGVPPEGILEVTRVMSQGMANVAASAAQAFGEVLLQPGDSERDVALRSAEATRELFPLLAETAKHVLRLQQLEQVRRIAIDGAALSEGRLPGAEEMSVAFADLAGFTRLGDRIPAEELGSVAGRLAELAIEVADPPTRLVKTIGDAAMFVSPETHDLLNTVLDLLEAAEKESESFPAVHAGVARGQVIGRAGDWYGASVNLASRITDFAWPGSVVAAKDIHDAASGDYRWSRIGRRRLKGVKGETELYRVRRPED
ncbi:MAG: adenylate cyclase regulatory domain-containing protein [Thermoleophilaceae bacterium]